MPKTSRTRQACDRCHSQKLRCPKQLGSPSCSRCARAGIACVYSPIGTGGTRLGGGGGPSGVTTTATATAATIAGTTDASSATHDVPMNTLWSDPLLGFDAPNDVFDPSMNLSLFETPVLHHDQEQPNGDVHMHDYAHLPNMSNQDPGSIANNISSNGINVRAENEREAALFHLPASSSGPTTTTTPVASVTQRLSALVSSLDETWLGMPSPRFLHLSWTAPAETYQHRVSSIGAALPKLFEDIFSQAQALADLYPPVVQEVCRASPPVDGVDEDAYHDDDACQVDDCIHKVELPGAFTALVASPLNSRLGVAASRKSIFNAAILSLLVACHTKLLDVLGRAFQYMTSCFKTTVMFAPGGKPQFDVPELKVGGFAPPKESAAAMQLVLLNHLVGRLAVEAGKLEGAVQDKWKAMKIEDYNGDEGPPPSEVGLAAMQVEVLREKAVEASDELTAIRGLFRREGVVE